MAKSLYYQPDTNISMFPGMDYFLGAPKYPNAMDQIQAGKKYQDDRAVLDYRNEQRELGESLDPEADLASLSPQFKRLALKSGQTDDYVKLDQFDYNKSRAADEDEKRELERLNKVLNIAEKNPSVALKAAGQFGVDISPDEILTTFERKHAKKADKPDKPKKEFLYDNTGRGAWYDTNSLTIDDLNQYGLSKTKPKEAGGIADMLREEEPVASEGVLKSIYNSILGSPTPSPTPQAMPSPTMAPGTNAPPMVSPTPTPTPSQSPLAGAQRDDTILMRNKKTGEMVRVPRSQIGR